VHLHAAFVVSSKFIQQISSRVSQRNEPLLISVPLNTTPNFPSLDLGSAEASYDDDTRVQEFLDKVWRCLQVVAVTCLYK